MRRPAHLPLHRPLSGSRARPLSLAGPFTVVAACSALLLSGCGAPAAPAPEQAVAVEASAGTSVGTAADPGTALGPTCTSPAGFSIDRPEGWSVASGTQLPACGWFDPEPVDVPAGTDVRTAITVRVENGPVAAVWPDERSRTTVEVAGRPAHRIEQVTTAGLYPAGTPITSYAVPLGDGRTLVADTVGLAAVDHERNVRVLDAMMRSLEIHGGPAV